ncbi:MAG: hypothetical protein EBQ96_06160 [Proteobacteria bacterium]|nr:hypothetical protein [Pseudomonadota bacterium]
MKALQKFAEITAGVDPATGRYVVLATNINESPRVAGLPSVSADSFEAFMRVAAQAVVERSLDAETLRITHPEGEVVSIDLRFEVGRLRVA